MKKDIKDIFANVIIVILTIITIMLIYVFAQTTILGKPYANLFGYSIFEVQTGSMADTIEIGDIIIVKLDAPIQENDIITFQSNGYLVTHRALEIGEDYIITKGDNNNTQDEPITQDDVIGKVVHIFNDINIWKKVFTDSKVLLCIAVTFTIFMALILYKEDTGVSENEEEVK